MPSEPEWVPIAYRLASKISSSYPEEHREDIQAECMAAAVKAAQSFDPGQGVQWSTYLYRPMQWAASHYRRQFEVCSVSSQQVKFSWQLQGLIKQMEGVGFDSYQAWQVLLHQEWEALDSFPPLQNSCLAMVARCQPYDWESVVQHGYDAARAELPAEQQDQPSNSLPLEQALDLMKALDGLCPTDAEVINLWLTGHSDDDIADALLDHGLTVERITRQAVSQRRQRILRDLREQI